MALFDSFLGEVKNAVFGDDADEVFDTVGGFLGDDGGGTDGGGGWGGALSSFLAGGSDDGGGGGGGGWGSALSSFLGSGSDDGSDGDGGGGGWAGALGGIVDRLSGDGGRDGLWNSVVDKASSYLPEEVRSAAGSLVGGENSSWAGSLVDPTSTSMPAGWQSVANTAVGHSYGEGGFDGFLEHSLGNLTGYRPPVGAIAPEPGPGAGPRPGMAADVMPGPDHSRPISEAATSGLAPDDLGRADDPRVTTHADDLGPARYDDNDNDNDNDDYDDLVTSGASSPGHEAPDNGYEPVPDDPTFPADIDPAPAPALLDQPDAAPPPMDDFEQSIDAADQVDTSMDAMFEGLE